MNGIAATAPGTNVTLAVFREGKRIALTAKQRRWLSHVCGAQSQAKLE